MVPGKKKMTFKRWIWRCPYENCNAKSKMVLHFHNARRHGRNHMKRIHNDNKTEPIVEKMGGEKIYD